MRSSRLEGKKERPKGGGWGCLFFVGVVIVLSMLFGESDDTGKRSTPTSTPTRSHAPGGQEWYLGGTLQGAKMREWREASYRDRLATSADFLVRFMQLAGRDIPSADSMKGRVIQFEAAISGANPNGDLDSEWAAEVAATVWLRIKSLGG